MHTLVWIDYNFLFYFWPKIMFTESANWLPVIWHYSVLMLFKKNPFWVYSYLDEEK